MTIAICDGLANARLTATANYFDAGAGSGHIQFWSGTRPASGGTPTGTKLGEIVLAEPCGTVASRALTLVTPQSVIAIASGTVAWARIIDGSGAWAIDGDCSTSGGGGDFILTALGVFAGGTLTLTSAVFG